MPSDDDEVGEAEVVDATAVAVAEKHVTLTEPSVVPDSGLVRHMRHRTIRAKDLDGGLYMTACGLTFLPDDFEELDLWPAVAWSLCKRNRCACVFIESQKGQEA